MPDGYPLETRLPLGILPLDIEHIRSEFTGDDLQSSQLVARIIDGHPINPGPVCQNGGITRTHRLYDLEPYLGLRTAILNVLVVFQKDRHDLD